MRSLVVLAAAAGLAAAAPVPKDLPKTAAEKIVGTWKLVKSTTGLEKQYALHVEFTKDGKLYLRRSANPNGAIPGKPEETGTYKVDGDKLPYALDDPDGGKRSGSDKIDKLTEDELVVTDSGGNTEEYVRVKDPPKK